MLSLGAFIDHAAAWSFVAELDEIETHIAEQLSQEPERAVEHYEAFIADCYEKADEIDNTSGNLGMFVASLFCGWIKARQAAGSDIKETARKLLAGIDKDDYAFCHQLEREAVKAFTKKGLWVFATQVRARLDTTGSHKVKIEGRSTNHCPDYLG